MEDIQFSLSFAVGANDELALGPTPAGTRGGPGGFFNMTGDWNILSYLKDGGLVRRDSSERRSKEYFPDGKDTFFNTSGFLGNDETARMAERAADGEKSVWYGLISFYGEAAETADTPQKCIPYTKVFTPLYKDLGIDPENTELMCCLHMNKNHPHIHFVFWEKQPPIYSEETASWIYTPYEKGRRDKLKQETEGRLTMEAYTLISCGFPKEKDRVTYAADSDEVLASMKDETLLREIRELVKCTAAPATEANTAKRRSLTERLTYGLLAADTKTERLADSFFGAVVKVRDETDAQTAAARRGGTLYTERAISSASAADNRRAAVNISRDFYSDMAAMIEASVKRSGRTYGYLTPDTPHGGGAVSAGKTEDNREKHIRADCIALRDNMTGQTRRIIRTYRDKTDELEEHMAAERYRTEFNAPVRDTAKVAASSPSPAEHTKAAAAPAGYLSGKAKTPAPAPKENTRANGHVKTDDVFSK